MEKVSGVPEPSLSLTSTVKLVPLPLPFPPPFAVPLKCAELPLKVRLVIFPPLIEIPLVESS